MTEIIDRNPKQQELKKEQDDKAKSKTPLRDKVKTLQMLGNGTSQPPIFPGVDPAFARYNSDTNTYE